jgi:signal peptidase I
MAKNAEKPEGIWELFKTVFWALIIAGIFRTLFFQPFWIPSGSMKDNLLIGDFLFVNKMAYGYSRHSCPFSACPFPGRIFGVEPDRGDVVVFRHPVNGSDFIKRLVGLPGEKIQMKDGVLHINGDAVKLETVSEFEELHERQGSAGSFPRCENTSGVGGTCKKGRMIETLPNGTSHSILNISDQPKDNTGIFIVPDGHYFFLGDNRDNSTDSRFPQNAGGLGYVPFENLIGRADRIMFSSAGNSLFYFWTWRSDRFFKAVH